MIIFFKKIYSHFFLPLTFLFLATSCLRTGGDAGSIHPSPGGNAGGNLVSIQVVSTVPRLPAGYSSHFKAYGLFTDGSQTDITNDVVWDTPTPQILHIQPTPGWIKGLVPGAGIVRAALGSISGSIEIEVTNSTLTDLSITPASLSLLLGEMQQLHAQGRFSDGTQMDITQDVQWSSDNSSLVSVGSANGNGGSPSLAAGEVHGQQPTTNAVAVRALMDIEQHRIEAVALVSVQQVDISGIQIVNADGFQLPAGTSQVLTANILYTNSASRPARTSEINWISSDSQNAAIQVQNGQWVVQAVGRANIVVELTAQLVQNSNITSTIHANIVSTLNIEAITIEPLSFDLAAGQSKQLAAYGVLGDGSVQDISFMVTWKSSNVALASVSSAGLVSANTNATVGSSAFITVTYGAYAALSEFKIAPALPTSLVVTPNLFTFQTAAPKRVFAMAVFADGHTEDYSSKVVWSANSQQENAKVDIVECGFGCWMHPRSQLGGGFLTGDQQLYATLPAGGNQQTALVSNTISFRIKAGEGNAYVTHGSSGLPSYAQGAITMHAIGDKGILSSAQMTMATSGPQGMFLSYTLPASGVLAQYAYVLGGKGGVSNILSVFLVDPVNGHFSSVQTVNLSASYGNILKHPGGQILYVAPATGKVGHVQAFSINNQGQLTAQSVSASSSISAFDIAPNGYIAYATLYNAGTNSYQIVTYQINQSTGALTPTAATSLGVGLSPVSLQVSPTGKYVYVLDTAGYVSTYSVNVDASLTLISKIGQISDTGASALLVSPSESTLFVSDMASSTLSLLGISSQGIPSFLEKVTSNLSWIVETVVSPSQEYVYALHYESTGGNTNLLQSQVQMYSLDEEQPTSRLTPSSPSTLIINQMFAPTSITVD